MVADYGRSSGYGQVAPGRDLSPEEEERQNGRPPSGPDINSAIMGGMPLSSTPFAGAQQTLGARSPNEQALARQNGGRVPGGPLDTSLANNSGVMSPNQAPIMAPAGTPPPPTAPTYNSASWDTDSFAKPGYIAATPGNVMAGWDQTKWSNADHQTPKYAVGRILSQFAPSIAGLAQALPEIQKAYPGATFNGKDKITIPGVGTFDVLTNSGSGQNMGWAWQGEGGGAPQQTALQGAIMGGSPIMNPTAGVGGDDYASKLRAQVMASLMKQPGLNSLASQYMK